MTAQHQPQPCISSCAIPERAHCPAEEQEPSWSLALDSQTSSIHRRDGVNVCSNKKLFLCSQKLQTEVGTAGLCTLNLLLSL